MADVAHQGRSSVINEDKLGNDRTSATVHRPNQISSLNTKQQAGGITRAISSIWLM